MQFYKCNIIMNYDKNNSCNVIYTLQCGKCNVMNAMSWLQFDDYNVMIAMWWRRHCVMIEMYQMWCIELNEWNGMSVM